MLSGFRILASLKRLRGTRLDIFGYTAERQLERQLISDYETMLEHILAGLSADNLPIAVELGQLPDQIRGYAHVKDQSLAEVNARKADLMTRFAA